MIGVSNFESYRQSHVKPRIIREESVGSGWYATYYWIEENTNDPEGEGNLFLNVGRVRMVKRMMTPFGYVDVMEQPDWDYGCIGGMDKVGDGKYRSDILCPCDEETEADCEVVYTGDSREEAIEALWNNRHKY